MTCNNIYIYIYIISTSTITSIFYIPLYLVIHLYMLLFLQIYFNLQCCSHNTTIIQPLLDLCYGHMMVSSVKTTKTLPFHLVYQASGTPAARQDTGAGSWVAGSWVDCNVQWL